MIQKAFYVLIIKIYLKVRDAKNVHRVQD